jgi:chromosome segregation ATPase
MGSQVISYRLSDEEVAALRRQALSGESDNQTAQRLARESLGLSTLSTKSLPVDGLEERIESIVEKRFESFALRLQERLQEEVKTEVKKLSSQIDVRVNLADVDSLRDSVDKLQVTVDSLQKERDELESRNLELEALEADLKNELALKDEELEQLREGLPEPNIDAATLLNRLKPLLGKNSKLSLTSLGDILKQISASPTG